MGDQNATSLCSKNISTLTNITITADYEGDQAPRVSDYNGRVVDGEPLPVTLNLEIQSFDDIDTSKMSFRYFNTFLLSIE